VSDTWLSAAVVFALFVAIAEVVRGFADAEWNWTWSSLRSGSGRDHARAAATGAAIIGALGLAVVALWSFFG